MKRAIYGIIFIVLIIVLFTGGLSAVEEVWVGGVSSETLEQDRGLVKVGWQVSVRSYSIEEKYCIIEVTFKDNSGYPITKAKTRIFLKPGEETTIKDYVVLPEKDWKNLKNLEKSDVRASCFKVDEGRVILNE